MSEPSSGPEPRSEASRTRRHDCRSTRKRARSTVAPLLPPIARKRPDFSALWGCVATRSEGGPRNMGRFRRVASRLYPPSAIAAGRTRRRRRTIRDASPHRAADSRPHDRGLPGLASSAQPIERWCRPCRMAAAWSKGRMPSRPQLSICCLLSRASDAAQGVGSETVSVTARAVEAATLTVHLLMTSQQQ